MIFLRSRFLYRDGIGFIRATPYPPQPAASQSASDSLAVSLTESASIAVTASEAASDAPSVAITESVNISARSSASDSLNVAATESASVVTSSPDKSGSDALHLALAENARLAANLATISASDSLDVAFTESAAESVQTTAPPPSSPGGGSQAGYVGGPVYIGQGRKFRPNPASTSSDAAHVTLAESATVLVQLAASDDLGIGTSSGSGDEVIGPVPFDQLLVTVDSLTASLSESALVSTTSGSDISWSANTNLNIRILENARVVTTNNQRLDNEVVGLRLIESASRLHIFPTGGTTPPTGGDNLTVGIGEGFQNQFTGAGISRLGAYGFLKLSIVEKAAVGVASVAAALNTAAWLEVAFTAVSGGVLLSQIGIEVIYQRVPARTTTDTAWPSTAQIQQDYPEESYVNFSFTG